MSSEAVLSNSAIFCFEGFCSLLFAVSMLQVKALDGSIQTVDATPSSTIRELKHMLVDQRPWEDCIDRKIGRATILTDAVLADDDQTLESSGILHADCNATVVYSRAKLEVARAKDICEKGFVRIIIPSGVDDIASGAFMRCEQAAVVEMPDSVGYIGRHAFMGCMFLERMHMSQSLRIIDNAAFANCRSLANIDLPDKLSYIAACAFADCKALRSITLPPSVTTLGSRAFMGCTSLERIMLLQALHGRLPKAFDQEVQSLIQYY